jgi:hypothetical protein
LGFSPDLVWLKNRDVASTHRLYNSLTYGGPYSAGASGSKFLASNSTAAETAGTANSLISLDADGFSVHGSGNDSNDIGEGYVAWAWDAGTGSAASNTDGSITSTVKANPDYGFSIGTFTKGSGTETFGHGLSSAPELLILKRRDSTGSWFSYSSVTGATKWIRLNGTDVATTDSTFWNDTAPTSSVATISTAYNSGEQLVFYAWNSVAGYSSISSYTGTGASGNAVTGLGFKPAFLMVKGTDVAEHWVMFDNTRSPTNPVDQYLLANATNAEETGSSTRAVDFDTDGFTVDGTQTEVNQSGKNYLYMAFADTREAAFWKDVSGQGNHWTPNNLDYRDSLIDSPANNFATLNPLDSNSNITLAKGNLKASNTSGYWYSSRGTFSPTSGKWYFEAVMPSYWAYLHIGVLRNSYNVANANAYTDVGNWTYQSDGRIHNNGTQVTTNVPASGAGDVMQVAYDLDDGKIWFGINNTWILSGNPTTGANPVFTAITSQGDISPHILVYGSPTTGVVTNFGQDSTFSGNTTAGGNTDANNIGDFAYAPPAGFLSLCSASLPTPSIVDGSEHFNTVLYTGNGSTQSITGVGFASAPDFVWIKQRNAAENHFLTDSVRGAGFHLRSDQTTAESDSSATFTSFDADGFSLTGTGSAVPQVNDNGDTYAAWNWKAGGTAVSNTDGSITSQVSANVDAGFSIVSFDFQSTGNQTIGHGLSTKPAMIIMKSRDTSADAWWVYHESMGASNYLRLNANYASTANSGVWSTTPPTNQVFSVGSQMNTSNFGTSQIAYCFANTDGYLKAGSYTGNGSSDGPFVYTGFRPAWVMFKCTSLSGSQWVVYDAVRDSFNPVDSWLNPNRINAEGTDSIYDVDFTANGFKIRNSDIAWNTSGASYIYLAFAENPFKYANAR